MTGAGAQDINTDRHSKKRRIPQQSRSRERVERILDTAADLVVAQGVDALSTRGIAEAAGIPVASLYQYFADKDEILLAIVERDIEVMDTRVEQELARLQCFSVTTITRTTMEAFVAVFRTRPAFVTIWLRGRGNAAVRALGREHNRQVARDLFGFARSLGLLVDAADPLVAELAVETGDRLFQIAFEHDDQGDERVIDEGIRLVTTYLELYATTAGRNGVLTS